jgi:transposase InsO family protein
MIPPSWSFVVRGLDILGPFPRAIRGFWYLYITVDKFTNLPEATPVVKINKKSTVKFIKSIVCMFGVPNMIITDNRSQFTSIVFQEYYEDLSVQIYYTSIAHPESNEQVERANAKILRDLKTHTYDCLKKHGAKWIDDLPCALWTNRTSSCWATGEMPFLWAYGGEAIIPRNRVGPALA